MNDILYDIELFRDEQVEEIERLIFGGNFEHRKYDHEDLEDVIELALEEIYKTCLKYPDSEEWLPFALPEAKKYLAVRFLEDHIKENNLEEKLNSDDVYSEDIIYDYLENILYRIFTYKDFTNCCRKALENF